MDDMAFGGDDFSLNSLDNHSGTENPADYEDGHLGDPFDGDLDSHLDSSLSGSDQYGHEYGDATGPHSAAASDSGTGTPPTLNSNMADLSADSVPYEGTVPHLGSAVATGAALNGADAPMGGAAQGGETLQWYQSSDGTVYSFDSQGTYYELLDDGTVGAVTPDGYLYQLFPDGTQLVWDPNGYPVTDPYSSTAPSDSSSYDEYSQYSDDSQHSDSSQYSDNYTNPSDGYSEPDLIDGGDGVYGNAYAWTSDWFFQEVDGYCGPTSVAIMVNEFFGANISDPEQMVDMAYDLGLTEDISQGMYFEDVLTLLQANDVPAELSNSSMPDLAEKLESGYGVIAMVDAGEIWGTDSSFDYENEPDHFLIVTEVDTINGTVTLADPGNPNGNATEIPIEEFEDAWADSGYQMISTTEADPNTMDSDGNAGYAVSSKTGTTGNDYTDKNLAMVNLTGSDPIK